VVGFFVAAAVVTTLRFLRAGERRLLYLVALFLLLAAAHSLDWTSRFKDPLHFAAGFAGLGLAWALTPRTGAGAVR
jgi:hypothetical protein